MLQRTIIRGYGEVGRGGGSDFVRCYPFPLASSVLLAQNLTPEDDSSCFHHKMWSADSARARKQILERLKMTRPARSLADTPLSLRAPSIARSWRA
jgi:hypothetical protein